eukprot:CAMPEP_0113938706 /NCGR_PEP_ID=MMETSP1339-20121228/5125_1 /TAXON_ID=94617 /ORGANISM="Fibrocapsa japonica" /LENGTH=124 /DNA_ID=CAMNT_0000941941 /DNA_START=92 /DNA_END=463 /DNA_ORIENTATION=+ /assembly_acc=CAM_ASM_000762
MAFWPMPKLKGAGAGGLIKLTETSCTSPTFGLLRADAFLFWPTAEVDFEDEAYVMGLVCISNNFSGLQGFESLMVIWRILAPSSTSWMPMSPFVSKTPPSMRTFPSLKTGANSTGNVDEACSAL